MRGLIQQIAENKNYSQLLEWGRLLAITGAAQVAIQVIGLTCGIIIVRVLPTDEYALYTLANMMLGTMTVLADGGISTAVMSEGGKVWKDPVKLGAVIATGLDLRRKFAVASIAIFVPVLFILLRHHHASLLMSVLIILSLIPAFFTALSGTLLEIVPKLRQDITPLQKNQVTLNIYRLLTLGITVFAFPYATIAVFATGLPQVFTNRKLKHIVANHADYRQRPDPQIQKNILAMVARILPGALYYCFSGQITIWLVSILGATVVVAQVGALGRLALLLNLFNILFLTLIIPRFSRLHADRKVLLKRFVQIQIGLVLLSLTILTVAQFFSEQVLWVLGREYAGLKKELLLNITASCISMIAGVGFSLYTGRGWAIRPFVSVPVNIASIICGIAIFNISSFEGILQFNIFLAFVQLFMNGGYCLLKILQLK